MSQYRFRLGGADVPFEILEWETRGEQDNLLALRSRYDARLVAECKGLEGRKWRAAERVWTFPNTQRNRYALQVWTKNPYVARYDMPLRPVGVHRTDTWPAGRPLKPYQSGLMVPFFLQRRRGILAAEQGLGKTLAAGEAMERLRELEGFDDWWYVCQKNAFDGVKDDWRKWSIEVLPRWFTYDELHIYLRKHPDFKPPRGVVFDESALLKNPSAIRSAGALKLQARMDEEYGERACVWLMSGVPAPQDPSDWWCQAEIAQPGFLREPGKRELLRRIAVLTTDVEAAAEAEFKPAREAWERGKITYDEFETAAVRYADKTKGCRNATTGQVIFDVVEWKHDEVELLRARLDGLVLRMTKAEHRKDLPAKVRRVVRCEYTLEDLELAETVAGQAKSGSKAAIDLRTLSDGFRYHETEGGEREIIYAGSPKEDALRAELEKYSEWRRVIVFAGFQASVDLCTKICREAGWGVIQVDGRSRLPLDLPPGARPSQATFLNLEEYPMPIAWVANAGAGGMGQTLVTSPVEIFYSNGYKGGDRAQAEDRFHREGAQENPTIVDLFWLPTDEHVLGVLEDKKALSALTTADTVDVIRKARERLVGRAAGGEAVPKLKQAELLDKLGAAKEDMPCRKTSQ